MFFVFTNSLCIWVEFLWQLYILDIVLYEKFVETLNWQIKTLRRGTLFRKKEIEV